MELEQDLNAVLTKADVHAELQTLADTAAAEADAEAKRAQDAMNLAIANAKAAANKAAAARKKVSQQDRAATATTAVVAVTPNVKTLANKVEAKVVAQKDKAAPVSSFGSAPIKLSKSVPIKPTFPVQEVVTAKAASMDDLTIESIANKSSSSSKKIKHLQTQLNTLHEIVHASNREREKIKVSIADMESKIVGEMSNLATLIKANVTEPVKHEKETNDFDLSPSDMITVNSITGSNHARPHLQKSLAANFAMKTPRARASVFVKTPHGPQHTFTFEDMVKAISHF